MLPAIVHFPDEETGSANWKDLEELDYVRGRAGTQTSTFSDVHFHEDVCFWSQVIGLGPKREGKPLDRVRPQVSQRQVKDQQWEFNLSVRHGAEL